MDTTPITAFINEVKDRKQYFFPPEMAFSDKSKIHWYQRRYYELLSRMEQEFEDCVFQCVAENPLFKNELHVIVNKLSCVIDWKRKQEIKKLGKSPYGDSKRVAVRVGEKCLKFLQDNYDIILGMIADPQQETISKPSVVPHFKGLSITEEQASKLYDKLVPSRLEDTGKSDFIYYFTGKGKQPSNKLIWKGDAIFLSNIMSILSPNRIPWKQMDTFFEGLNTDSMKSNLTKSKDSTAFKSDKRMIEAWLKTDSDSIIKSVSAL